MPKMPDIPGLEDFEVGGDIGGSGSGVGVGGDGSGSGCTFSDAMVIKSTSYMWW